MSNLGPQQQNVSYNGILQVPGGVTAHLQQVQDGEGRGTGLFVSSTGANVTTSDSFLASINGVSVAGAVPRLISDGFGDYISVKDFGAVGDGTTDDSAAINAAILYLQNTASVKGLFFPSAVYAVGAPIVISGSFGEGVVIEGNGSKIVGTASTDVFYINALSPTVAPQGRINLFLKDFVVIGLDPNDTDVNGVHIYTSAAVRLENVNIQNCYRALYGEGCLISSFVRCQFRSSAFGINFRDVPGVFAPNDVHFICCQVIDNQAAIKYRYFDYGSLSFYGCEIEGNNRGGTATDGIKVIELSTAGKVSFYSCHMEDNPGQYNIFYSSPGNRFLNLVGCEVIPGDDCGNCLYMDAGQLSIIGSRVTNNTGNQIYFNSGATGFIDCNFSGALSGSLDKVLQYKDGALSFAGKNSSVAAITATSTYGIAVDAIGKNRFIDSSYNRLGYTQYNGIACDPNEEWSLSVNNKNSLVVNRTGGNEVEPGDATQSFGSAAIRWGTAYTNHVNTGDITVSGGALISSGYNSPEGVITAVVGSLYLCLNGGAGTTLYVKQSGTGNTGWVGK